jgi:hypothetical protein
VQRQVHSSSLFIGASAARSAIAACVLALVACGGDSSGPPLTLSGTVSGLTTSGLSLTTLGVNLEIKAGATSFTFGPILTDGVGYDVTAPNQPAGQLCTVTNGTGTATTADISNVVVTCSNQTFNIGGTISGLTAAGLVLANGSDSLSVAEGASSFTMPTAVAYGSDYKVTVTTQPTGLTCDVADGTGTVGATAVTNIAVTCTDQAPAVGGSISGLERATGLVLANGTETYAVPAGATSFRLDAPQPSGSTYAVRVQSQPTGVTCSVSQGLGTMPTHNVTDVSIICSDEAYSLGGAVAGLTSAGLVLSDGSNSYSVPVNATNFAMPTPIASGSSYTVSVQTQPAGLTCTIADGTGTMPANAVTKVGVTCASTSYTLGGSISGLKTSGLVLTDGMDDLSVAANASHFSMPNALAYGSDYTVTIKAQPGTETCQIAHGTGTVSGYVGTVEITCGSPATPP